MAHDETISDEHQDGKESQARHVSRRRMFISGAGVAGAAVLAKATTASAADGDDVLVGGEYTAETRTQIDITSGPFPIAGAGNAIKGIISDPTNGSHAILGVTQGGGHAIAGDVPAGTGNTVGATWGRHAGLGAGAEGVNTATDVPLAGPAHGVKGTVADPTNGSHAVIGITNGAGHSVAGDTPAGTGNTTAATWGRHGGAGAGIGGVSADGYGGEFVGGRAQVRLIQAEDPSAVGPPTGNGHLLGELYADGAGNLWFNQGAGERFTRLNHQTVILPDPERAYDSRPGRFPNNTNQGRFADGETREIDLTEFTALPAGASAAVINLTVAQTGASPGGWVTVFNGDTPDADRTVSSSINWYEENQIVANGLTVPVSSTGTVKVYANVATHVVIDVTGYLA